MRLLVLIIFSLLLPAAVQAQTPAVSDVSTLLLNEEQADDEEDDVFNTNPCSAGCYRGFFDAYGDQSTAGKVIIAAGLCGATLFGIWWGLEVGCSGAQATDALIWSPDGSEPDSRRGVGLILDSTHLATDR